MVQLVLSDIWVKLGELIVHVSSRAVVLDIEIAVSQQRQGRAVSGRELELVRQDTDDLNGKSGSIMNKRQLRAELELSLPLCTFGP